MHQTNVVNRNPEMAEEISKMMRPRRPLSHIETKAVLYDLEKGRSCQKGPHKDMRFYNLKIGSHLSDMLRSPMSRMVSSVFCSSTSRGSSSDCA